MEMNTALSDEIGKSIIARQLNKYVGSGIGKAITWAELEQLTGVKHMTLRSYAATPPATMPAHLMMSVFAHLPAAAWAQVNSAMGFCAPPRIDDADAACMRRALAQASQLVADGNDYLADGIIDPSERAKFSEAAEALIPTLRAHII